MNETILNDVLFDIRDLLVQIKNELIRLQVGKVSIQPVNPGTATEGENYDLFTIRNL